MAPPDTQRAVAQPDHRDVSVRAGQPWPVRVISGEPHYAPARHRMRYKARGQRLQQLPNVDLFAMPTEPDSIGTRQITDTPRTRQGSKLRRPAAALGALVVAGLALSGFVGDDSPIRVATTVVAPAGGTADQTTAIALAATETAPALPQIPSLTAPVPGPATAYTHVGPPSAPVLDTQQRDLPTPPETAPTPRLAVFADPAVRGSLPRLVEPATAPNSFRCHGCTAPQPAFQDITLEIHAAQTTPTDTVSALVRPLGFNSVTQTAHPITVLKNQVRFYHTTDAAAATALATRFDATLVDLTWYAPAPPITKIDLWLAPGN